MERRKRLKTSKSEINKNDIGKDPEFYFSVLPPEVLLHIYQYLSPLDLLSLSQLDQRIEESSSYLKVADFSSSSKASPEQVSSFFSRIRVKYIRKLNFNYNIFVKPSVLVQLICRCKENLTVLSIVECGIGCKHLENILLKCKKLEKLVWSVRKDNELALDMCSEKMNTVCLFYGSNRMRYSPLVEFMNNFCNLEYFYLSFATEKLAAFPFHGLWMETHSCTFPSEKIVAITEARPPRLALDIISLAFRFPSLHENKDAIYETRWLQSLKTVIPSNCPPYLQIQTRGKDMPLLSSKTYSSLSILATDEIHNFSENIVKNVEKVASNKLKLLSIGPKFKFEKESTSLTVCEVLRGLTRSCQNIAVLNLSFHFQMGSPFEAISHLQNLRTLMIATCCFRTAHKKDKLVCDFDEMVIKCAKVENFTLTGCNEVPSAVSDSDLYPLYLWKELKHLTMHGVDLQSSNFLKNVATNCEELKSLSIIDDSCFFPYNNSVIYLLKVAKKLSFIRINASTFNPMFERFWNSIGEAANLEGICIYSAAEGHLVKRTIIQAIKKLKYLHLFHFYHQSVSDNLINEVRKSMKENGVSNIKIEKDYELNFLTQEVDRRHLQSEMTCRHFHFEPLDI